MIMELHDVMPREWCNVILKDFHYVKLMELLSDNGITLCYTN